MNNIISEIKKTPNKNIFLEVFDKAEFIENISNSLKKGEKIRIKIDEKTKDYPNILNTDLPRFIIQKDLEKEQMSVIEHLKNMEGFIFNINKKGNDYFLEIHRTLDIKLNLKLKIDSDKTIDLNLLTDKKGKDNIFFGIKSYYYIRKLNDFSLT